MILVPSNFYLYSFCIKQKLAQKSTLKLTLAALFTINSAGQHAPSPQYDVIQNLIWYKELVEVKLAIYWHGCQKHSFSKIFWFSFTILAQGEEILIENISAWNEFWMQESRITFGTTAQGWHFTRSLMLKANFLWDRIGAACWFPGSLSVPTPPIRVATKTFEDSSRTMPPQ